MLFKPEDYRPTPGYVLAAMIPETETESGLALPDGVQTGFTMVKVVAAADYQLSEFDFSKCEMPCKSGDLVVVDFPNHSPPIGATFDGVPHILFKARHIHAVVSK